jgi:CheY-like chemotaxis protein
MGLINRKRLEPSAQACETAAGELSARQPRARPGVLVVDDEHVVRIIVQLGLERENFHVWLASNGREAIELYRTHRDHIDVVLLDVCMPGLDGFQTLERLRELNPRILTCFMSGHPGSYRPEELRQRDAAQVIAKPFHLDQLAHVLRLLVNGGPAALLPSGGNARVETGTTAGQGGTYGHDSCSRR